jgi:hypothetical protein
MTPAIVSALAGTSGLIGLLALPRLSSEPSHFRNSQAESCFRFDARMAEVGTVSTKLARVSGAKSVQSSRATNL